MSSRRTVVINLFHPDLSRSATNRVWATAAREAGFPVRDLYALYPEGTLDIAEEQRVCEEAGAIVFQHPMHWYGAPWLLKKWIDEVLTGGWAYGGPDRLAGKRWRQAISVGAGASEYGPDGSRRYFVPEFLRPFERTAGFCRMEFDTFFRFGAGYNDDATIRRQADEYVAWLRGESVQDRPVGS
ncbi:MAG: NAD(P)H-dependent oxidoreductase [Capsulimonadales bacterium]|nr:NAD(P)H-dependent oxidoreductase [Capsulimonadales bacterium]